MSGSLETLDKHAKHAGSDTEKGEEGIDAAVGTTTNLGTSRLDPYGSALVPTPTSDPLDPLNWTKFQKYVLISIVCANYFLFTYLTTATVPSFVLLQDQFGATFTEINWTLAIPALGLAVGPLFCSAVADIYGRRIVMIIGSVIALIASGCTSLHGISFGGYMAARFFQGLGASPAATVGLSIINDISFEHERGFRIGLWVMAIDLGLYFGAFIGAFVALADQYWVAYHVTILFAVLLVVQCLFLRETLYPRTLVLTGARSISPTNEKDGVVVTVSDIKKTTELGYLHFGKIPGINHPKPWDTIIRFVRMFGYPTVVISTFAFVFFQYWWLLSLVTMQPAAYVTYSLESQGLFYIGLILGTLFGELLCSGRQSDWLSARLAKKNGGVKSPEMRLYFGYPAAVLGSLGLLIWGLSIDRNWHWMTGQVAFFLFGAGLQIGNTALSAYIVDSYYEHSMDIITFYAVILNLSAFIEPWFINLWVTHSGFTWSFAAQAIICTVGVVPVYVFLQKFGPRMRKPMNLGTVNPVVVAGGAPI